MDRSSHPQKKCDSPLWRLLVICALAEVGLAAVAGPRIRGLLFNTMLLALGSLAISLPLGTLLATLVTKTDMPGGRWLGRLLTATLFVPLYVQAAAWQAAVGLGGWGPTAPYFSPLASGTQFSLWLDGWRGAIWVHAMGAVPWVVVFVAAALRTVARELEEDALLAASPLRVILRVTFRQASAGVATAALWIAVVCASETTVTDLFQVRSFAEEVYTAASMGESLDSSDLWLGTAAIAVLVIAALLATRHWLIAGDVTSQSSSLLRFGWRWRMGRMRPIAAIVGWLLAAVLVGVPLGSMAWKAGAKAERAGDTTIRSWSAEKMIAQVARSPREHAREWSWSFAIGGAATAAAMLVGTSLAWAMRKRWLPILPISLLLAVSFALPGPVLGVWLIRLLNQPDGSALSFLTWYYDYTILAPVLAQAFRALPLTTFLVWTQMASVPQDLLDSAASEGAGWFRQLCQVVLPLIGPGVLAAACVAFVIAIGELAATVLVTPPGISTLSIRIFGLLHYGAEDRVAAICLAIWLLVCLLTVCFTPRTFLRSGKHVPNADMR